MSNHMYKLNFDKPVRVHFMGIGGVSMSGLAEILLDRGFTVTGSDMKEAPLTQRCVAKGAKVVYAQVAENITDDIDVLVYTQAIREDNPEFMAAKEKGIPMLDRAELLGQIMTQYENSIGVSGTHGKTTTTSMLSQIFLDAAMDPTISVGSALASIQGNIRIGRTENMIVEACEYTNSFLRFDPKTAIILNIEAEHLDFFKDLAEIRQSFRAYAAKLPADGLLVINGEIDDVHEIYDGIQAKVLTYGIDGDYDYTAANIVFDENACATYDVMYHGEKITTIVLKVPGMHNVSNSLSVVAVALSQNISLDHIKSGLLTFGGAKRRFEYKGKFGEDVPVIDDYAHHPTEVRATIAAAENYPHDRLWIVFQPHLFSRTKDFLEGFAEALSLADKVIVTDIYNNREIDTGMVHSRDLQKLISETGTDAYYIAEYDDIVKFLKENCIHGDMLITMGTGNIAKVAEAVVEN